MQIVQVRECLDTISFFFPISGDFRKKTATVTTDSKYLDLLRDLAVIKLRLETLGYGPLYIEGPFDNGPMAKSLQGKLMSHHQFIFIARINKLWIYESNLLITLLLYGLPSADKEVPSTEDPPSPFNEMEVLELVPVIIEQKRKGNVSPAEEMTLKEIFGDLWIVIEEEVNRSENDEMNPILKALLQSHDLRLKRALMQHQQQQLEPMHQRERQQQRHQRKQVQEEQGLEVGEGNDIFRNSVDRVRVTRWPKSFIEVNAAELSPQQRLIRHAAFLIRQWFDENPTRNSRKGLKRNRVSVKKMKKNKRGSNRRGKNNNGVSGARRRKNLRPKRHNTDIYVDDNHAGYDYEDFGDYFTIDDMMTKPRSMRSSIRTLFNEYDSMEDEVVEFDNEEDYEWS